MLHALVEYGRKQNITGEAGFTSKTIRWLINFDTDGNYLGIMSLGDPADKRNKGRIFEKVPHLKFSGDTPMRQFLVDTAQYALLYEEDQPDSKLLKKHEFYINLLRKSASTEPFLGKIAKALSNNEIRQKICNDLQQQSPKAKASDNVSFAEVSGGSAKILVEDTIWHDWWRGYFPTLFKKEKGKKNLMRCFISGELIEPAQTHPKIKQLGDVGGNIETTLVGFNLDAFCSFGLEQSQNAAISSEMAEQYAAVLNNLLSNNTRRLVGIKIVYWYTGDVKPEEDPMPSLFGDAIFNDADVNEEQKEVNQISSKRERLQAENRVAELLDSIRTGKRSDLKKARYCAMTLSGNAGRVVVRDWMEGQFEDLVNNINVWFRDTAIVTRDGYNIIGSHKLFSILAAPVRESKEITQPIEEAIWQSAIKNKPLPYQVMIRTLMRVRNDIISDEVARHARVGLLKAYSNRNERMPNMTEKLNPVLKDSAYLSGRILALLADIQWQALGDVGAGIVQRYYAAASATPGLVLGRLVRLANMGHLPKIEPVRLRKWFENQLAQIWKELDESPPATLSLEKQTLFAMGYYQQKANRPTKEEQDNNVTNNSYE